MLFIELFTLGIGSYAGWSIIRTINEERSYLVLRYFLMACFLSIAPSLLQLKEDFHNFSLIGPGLQSVSETIGKTSGFFDFGTSDKPLGSSILDKIIPFRGGKFSWPIKGEISKAYGPDNHGLDIKAPEGDPIQASRNGVVKSITRDDIYGVHIIIDHGSGWQTLYAHLSTVSVRSGQQVFEKDLIGKVGSTGNSTGPHLHFEIRQNGQTVDPAKYLK